MGWRLAPSARDLFILTAAARPRRHRIKQAPFRATWHVCSNKTHPPPRLQRFGCSVEAAESYRAARGAGSKDQGMEVAGMKAQRQTWSEADVYKLKNAVKRAQGTDDAGVKVG